MKRSALYCRVYYSLLALSYLEVVLWTSCLFVTCTSKTPLVAAHSYLQRETVNLKAVEKNTPPSVPVLDLASARIDLLRRLESKFLLWRKDPWQLSTPVVLQEGIVGISNLPVQNGLPAPFAGVKALS